MAGRAWYQLWFVSIPDSAKAEAEVAYLLEAPEQFTARVTVSIFCSPLCLGSRIDCVLMELVSVYW